MHSTEGLVPPRAPYRHEMRHGLSLPPFGALSDLTVLSGLAREAEQAEWDGVFLWDHILRPPGDPLEIADTSVALTAIAAATSRVVIGPMVTPPTRRRPQKLAREVATLDRFSNGRVVLGLGLGVDSGGELSRFDEVVDPRVRADRMDEAVELICDLWSGNEVNHRGEHFTVDGVTMRPTPLQSPRVPLWFAARSAARRPVRRAAKYDGIFPIEVDFDGLGSMLDVVAEHRGSLEDFDVAVHHQLSDDAGPVGADRLAEIGVTWMIHGFSTHATADDVRRVIEGS